MLEQHSLIPKKNYCWGLSPFPPFLLPAPTPQNTAAGSRNTSSLPDRHIHYSLSFTSKQSCTVAFEKVMLRNLSTHPNPRSGFRDIYLSEVTGKTSDYFHAFPCSMRDSVPCCKYLSPKYFIIFLFALVTHLIIPSSFMSISSHSFWSAILCSTSHLSYMSHQLHCQPGRFQGNGSPLIICHWPWGNSRRVCI